MDKQTYRITIFLTDEKYKNTPPSTIFLNALPSNDRDADLNAVAAYASLLFKKQYAEAGIVGMKFKVEARISSMEEANMYAEAKKRGEKTNRVVN